MFVDIRWEHIEWLGDKVEKYVKVSDGFNLDTCIENIILKVFAMF